MKQSELKARVSEIRNAFDAHASTAPTYADPSWFAHRGYVSAAGESGAGHLAWERIAPELLQLRATYTRLGRPFKDHELAFVMAYGLGLTDQGSLSHAAADELADAIMPAAREQRPLYRTPVFWMMTLMALLLDISVAVAVSAETPAYPTISEPLDMAPPSATSVVPAATPKPQPVRKVAAAAIDEFVIGAGDLDTAMTELLAQSETERVYTTRDMYGRLTGADRAAFVTALADVPGPAISTLIRRAYHADSSAVVLAAIAASVSRGDRLARIGLVSLLDHPEREITLRSLEALAVLGSAREAHAILPALDDTDTRDAARMALKSILGVDRGISAKSWRRYLHRRARRMYR